jgi:hypothetical protein
LQLICKCIWMFRRCASRVPRKPGASPQAGCFVVDQEWPGVLHFSIRSPSGRQSLTKN